MRHLKVDIGFICVHCGKKNVPPWNKTRYTTPNMIAETAICNFCEKEQKDHGTELRAKLDSSNGLAGEDGDDDRDGGTIHNLAIPPDFEEIRCVGYSTAIALRGLGEAIGKPGQWIYIQDHIIDEGNSYRQMRLLVEKIQRIIEKLELEDIKIWIRGRHVVIQSNHYGYVVGMSDGEIFKNKRTAV